MYWPEELPGGREKYHGKNELVASNHMEIIDAMTVSDRAEIVQWGEKDDDPMLTGLYWRQRFNYITKKLSVGLIMIICKRIKLTIASLSEDHAYANSIITLTSSSYTVQIPTAISGFTKTAL